MAGGAEPRPAGHGSPRLYVFVVAAFAALNSTNLGYDMGVNSSVGYHLQEKAGGMELTDLQLEMFFGIFGWAAILGALSAHSVSDRLGRRRAFAVSSVGFIVGVSWTALAPNYLSLMLGRLITGLGVGFGLAVDPLYISEVSPPEYRGRLVTWSETATNVGILMGFVAGDVLRPVRSDIAWRILIGIGAVLPVVLLILVFTVMPESPRWLVLFGREEEAEVILRRCYPEDADVPAVIQSIKDSIQQETEANGSMTWYNLLCRPSAPVRRMLIVGVGVAICQQTTAIEAIQYYLIYILDYSGVNSRSRQFDFLIALGVVKVSVIVLAGRLFDHPRGGRRPLLIASNIGIFVALVALGINLHQESPSVVLGVAALMVYMIFFSLGMGPGCWLLASEVFSMNIRARAMSIATFSNRALSATISSTFLTLRRLLSDTGFFLLFAGLVLCNILFIYCVVPETKGRTLEDMLRYFEEQPSISYRLTKLYNHWAPPSLQLDLPPSHPWRLISAEDAVNPLAAAADAEGGQDRKEAGDYEMTVPSTSPLPADAANGSLLASSAVGKSASV